MRCTIRLAGVVLSVFSFLLSFGAANGATPHRGRLDPGYVSSPSDVQLTLAQYQSELSRIDQQLKSLVEHPELAKDLRSSIPEEWEISTSSGTFDIDNQDIRSRLERYAERNADRGEILPELEFKVESQLEGAQEFERPTDSSAHNKLETILQGREYRNLSRSPSPYDILKERIMALVMRLFSKLFRIASAHPRISKVLLWVIIASVILGFAVWMYFLLRRPARDEYSFPRDGGALFPSSKPWQEWLRNAHAAAERGDWRDAVHLAYWCSISYLESTGVWKPDRTRTPREYLRSFKPQTGAGGRREPLEALTWRFESVWYAQQAASLDDFQFSLAQLDKIGCR